MGFGSAKIKLDLPGNEYRQGEVIQGRVLVEGGKVEQKVEQMYLHLDIYSQYEHDDKTHVYEGTVDTYTDSRPFEITGTGFSHEINFNYRVPVNIPVSFGRTRYQLTAGLDIKTAINPDDHVPLKVLPCPEIEAILGAAESLGFKHHTDSGDFNGRVQWFEFKPTGFMRDRLDELELSFVVNPKNVTVFFEIDKKGKGLAGFLMEAMDADEKHVSLTLPREILVSENRPNVDAARESLREFLGRCLK